MSNGSENNDVENDQSADSRKGSDESKVPSRWIIIFTVMSGVVMGLVFFQFVRTWPPCDVPTADAPPATAQTAAPALSAGKPGLTWVQPQSGVAAGNQQVKIIGVGLATASSASFGEAAAKILPGGDDTSISITTPAHKPGKVDVVVVTSAGQKLTLADAYTYLGDLPSITTISPATLPIDGGVMNIGGTNFLQNAIVSIGGIPSRSVNVDSSTSITAMAPSHKAGKVDIAVMNLDGQRAVKVDGVAYACPGPSGQSLFTLLLLTGALGGMVHTLRSFGWYAGHQRLVWYWMPSYFLVPLTGAALGLVFYLMVGSGFLPPSGTSADTSLVIIALTALAGMFSEQAMLKLKQIAEVVLTKPEQGANHVPASTSAASSSATSAAAPTITSILPKEGPAAGEIPVTIQGTGFSANVKVKFADLFATDLVIKDGTSITLRTPPHAAGDVDVVVVNSNGTSVTKKGAFKYQ